MKRILIPVLLCFVAISLNAQDNEGTNPDSRNVITTAVPFSLIAADARAAGMGDMGVATSVDGFAQQWNPAKYAFATHKQGIGITYTPYLASLVNDIFLGNVTYFNRINEQSAVAGSLRYFSLGEILLRLTADEIPRVAKPNELLLDLSYALRLSERFSMAVSGRYLRSDLKLQDSFEDASAGTSFAVDVSGYYQSEEIRFNDFDGRWRMGFNISNLGPKMKYDEVGQENFLPTNLGLGGGFDFILDAFNRVGVTVELNKLLVPTPPIRENGDIISGKDDNVSFFKGVFQSFGDAPGGFGEEMKEFTYALGAEYAYQESFYLRTGYFYEHIDKGGRQFLSLGAGFKYTSINIDMSYLFSTSTIRSPVEGTLRFGLTFNFGDSDYYIEY